MGCSSKRTIFNIQGTHKPVKFCAFSAGLANARHLPERYVLERANEIEEIFYLIDEYFDKGS